jgi:hypothetical protein
MEKLLPPNINFLTMSPNGILGGPLSDLSQDLTVLLNNGGFCNGCITKRSLILQAFHSQENQYHADYDKNITFFINLIFHHREKTVKLL